MVTSTRHAHRQHCAYLTKLLGENKTLNLPSPQFKTIALRLIHNIFIMSSNLLRTIPRASPSLVVRSFQQRAQGMLITLKFSSHILIHDDFQSYHPSSPAHMHPTLPPANPPTSRNHRRRVPRAKTSTNPAPTRVQKTKTLLRYRIP
jgi:hypothetical protein